MSRAPHVLVCRLDSAGDVLLAGPAVRAVRAGAREVTLLAGPRGLEAARLLPGPDHVLAYRAPWIDPDPEPLDAGRLLGLVSRVRDLRPDVAVILTSYHQSPLPTAMALRLAGVPRIGAACEDYPGSLLDVRHPARYDVHEVERALDLAGAMGFALPPGDDGRLRVRAAALPGAGLPGPYVVVHPGASVPARAWAPDRMRALVGLLAGRGWRVVVTGGPAERPLTRWVAGARRPAVRDLGGRCSLAGLAGVLAGAEAVVVGNTGPAHLAAAVGTPVASLFARTVPVHLWRPWGVPHEILGHDTACAGCRARACPVPGTPCLDVTPRDAADAVERLAGVPAARPGLVPA